MPYSLLYLAGLIFSIAGLGIADWRWKLAFFYDKKRTLLALGVTMLFFIIWDIIGIKLTIFFTGDSRFITGIFLLPDFPLEELFFLLLLSYTTLIIWRGVSKQ